MTARTPGFKRATGIMGLTVLSDAQVKAMEKELIRRFKARGYEGDTVTQLAGIVLGAAGSLIGSEDSIPAAAAEPGEKQAWLQAMVEKMDGRPLAEDVRTAAGKELKAKLRRRGFEKLKASQVAEIILGPGSAALPSPNGTPQEALPSMRLMMEKLPRSISLPSPTPCRSG